MWYKSKVCVNLIGVWKKGLAEPLLVIQSRTRVRMADISRANKNRTDLPRFEGTAVDDPANEQAAGEHGKDAGTPAIGLCHCSPVGENLRNRLSVWAADPPT